MQKPFILASPRVGYWVKLIKKDKPPGSHISPHQATSKDKSFSWGRSQTQNIAQRGGAARVRETGIFILHKMPTWLCLVVQVWKGKLKNQK